MAYLKKRNANVKGYFMPNKQLLPIGLITTIVSFYTHANSEIDSESLTQELKQRAKEEQSLADKMSPQQIDLMQEVVLINKCAKIAESYYYRVEVEKKEKVTSYKNHIKWKEKGSILDKQYENDFPIKLKHSFQEYPTVSGMVDGYTFALNDNNLDASAWISKEYKTCLTKLSN